MKTKQCLWMVLASLLLGFSLLPQSPLSLQAGGVDTPVYFTDFEGIVVNSTTTADNATGFVWANDWQNTRTESHNGSNMLRVSLFDNTGYSPVGGFGVGSSSNLARCVNGESYTCSTYFEMHGLDHVFVEFVGGDDKWGSVILYADGTIKDNPGGNNMSDVSYVNNVLTFTYTMDFCTRYKVNGYIQFVAYQTSGGYIYMDNCSIGRALQAQAGTFEEYSAGAFNSTDGSVHIPVYGTTNDHTSATSIVDVNGNKKVQISYTPNKNTEGEAATYLNRLGFLVRGRSYDVSLDLGTSNASILWLFYGGTWVSNPSYLVLNLTAGTLESHGDSIANANFVDGKLSFQLAVSKTITDWSQFEAVVQAKTLTSDVVLTFDNFRFVAVPIVSGVRLDTAKAKLTYNFGDELDLSGLAVYAVYSDTSEKLLSESDYAVSGFDSQKIGTEALTVTYLTYSAVYRIEIVRIVTALELDTSAVKIHYNAGQTFTSQGLKVYARYKDGGRSDEIANDVVLGGYAIFLNGFDSNRPGTYQIQVVYGDVTATYKVDVGGGFAGDFTSITYSSTGK